MVQLREGGSLGPVIATTLPLFLQHRGTEFTVFLFPDNVQITPNQTYYFQPTVLNGGELNVALYSRSTYDRGYAFVNQVTAPTFDLWFREGVVVPEPGAAWLFLAGAGALLVHSVGRRKHSA